VKKLRKTRSARMDTVEAYMCTCSCSCSCSFTNCSCGVFGVGWSATDQHNNDTRSVSTGTTARNQTRSRVTTLWG